MLIRWMVRGRAVILVLCGWSLVVLCTMAFSLPVLGIFKNVHVAAIHRDIVMLALNVLSFCLIGATYLFVLAALLFLSEQMYLDAKRIFKER